MPSPLLSTLQAVRLKGRTDAAAVAAATGVEPPAAQRALDALVAAELLREAAGRYRQTPGGREQLAQWLEQERAGVDHPALAELYHRFDPFNDRVKQLATAWQQRDGEPNDHADAEYDGRILRGVAALHADVTPLLAQFATLVPRLAPYGPRLDRAVARIAEGDHAYWLRPLIDSYHTVWFELHEDLIGLLGRTRQDEALAGRAE